MWKKEAEGQSQREIKEDFEDRGKGPKPRNAGNLWELGQVGKQILPWGLQQEHSLPTP